MFTQVFRHGHDCDYKGIAGAEIKEAEAKSGIPLTEGQVTAMRGNFFTTLGEEAQPAEEFIRERERLS